jgi:hypothetical protein
MAAARPSVFRPSPPIRHAGSRISSLALRFRLPDPLRPQPDLSGHTRDTFGTHVGHSPAQPPTWQPQSLPILTSPHFPTQPHSFFLPQPEPRTPNPEPPPLLRQKCLPSSVLCPVSSLYLRSLSFPVVSRSVCCRFMVGSMSVFSPLRRTPKSTTPARTFTYIFLPPPNAVCPAHRHFPTFADAIPTCAPSPFPHPSVAASLRRCVAPSLHPFVASPPPPHLSALIPVMKYCPGSEITSDPVL